MPAQLRYFCDHCGAMKGQANKWWIVTAGPMTVSIVPFSEGAAHAATASLACSSACLMKAIDGWCHTVTKAAHG